MASRSTSLKPVIDAITDVENALRAADLDEAQHFEREKQLRTLGGVKQMLEGMCMAPPGEEGYWRSFSAGGR